MAQPTHLQLVFARSLYIRKEHIAGQQAAQGPSDIMLIVQKGETKNIKHDVAQDLIIAKSALRADLAQNKNEIDAIREEAAQEKAKFEKDAAAENKLKKAA